MHSNQLPDTPPPECTSWYHWRWVCIDPSIGPAGPRLGCGL